MDSSLLERAKTFLRAQRKKSIWYRTMCGLAAVVVFITTYMLILPAITMERETICGKEEHVHTDECYKEVVIDPPRVLACSKEALEIHQHTDKCYDSDHNLICGYADFVIHTHDENCYDADGKLVCTLPEIKEYEHTASCYQEGKKLTCTKEESEGHTHTADCYKKEKGSLKCTIEEHEHNEKCYDESGNLICEKSEHKHDDNCYKWKDVLTCTQKESEGHKHTDTCYEMVRTLICDEQEAVPHTHTDSCYKDGKLACGKLETIKHQHTDDCWKADGEVATEKKLVCEKEEHVHGEECYKKETESVTEAGTEETNAEAEGTTEAGSETEKKAMMKGSSMFSAKTADEGISAYANGEEQSSTGAATEPSAESSAETPTETSAESTTEAEKSKNDLPVNKISGVNTEYDSVNDLFKTNVRIDFKFENDTILANTTYTYIYPAGVVIPENELNKKQNLKDGDKDAGTYEFIKNEDGTYSVQIVFNDNYVNTAGNTVTGYVQFEGNFDKKNMDDQGNIVVGTDDNTLVIPSKDIKYPADATESYDIDVSKSGSWVQEGDKLVYTVYVRTTKGTPNPISFSDTISIPEGVTLGEAEVTVKKNINHKYGEYAQTETEDKTIDVEVEQNGNTFTISLPQLKKTENATHEGWNGAHTDLEFYTITYIYPITDQTVEKVSLINNVSVTSSDDTKGQTVTDSAESTVNITKDFSYKLEKSGTTDSDKPGYVKWIITVNSNKVDISGAKLTDDMLELIKNTTTDIQISPTEGYKLDKTDDKISSITFTSIGDGGNKNEYSIIYYTPVERSWDGTTVTNGAKLDPKPNETGDEKETSATVTVDGMQFDKSGNYNGTTNQVDWTITINAGQLDITGAVLTDEMFSALSETAFTIEPENGYSFTKDSEGKINGITFVAAEGEKNTQSYTIKYSTTVTENDEGTVEPVTNNAWFSPGAEISGTPIEKNVTVTPEQVKLSKSGQYDYNGHINWTITVNEGRQDIASASLTDEAFEQLSPNDIVVYSENWQVVSQDLNQYTINTDSSGKIINIIFNAVSDDKNTNKYFITYSTEALREWEERIVENEVKLTLNGKEISDKADVTVPGDGYVSKAAGTAEISADGNTATIPWTVTIDVPSGGLPKGTIIEDDVTRGQYGGVNTNQWMTRTQIVTWATNLIWTDGSGNPIGGMNSYNPPPDEVYFLASNGNKYTYQQINEYNPSAGEGEVDFEKLTYTLFTISFSEALIPPEGASRLVFTYYTTVDLTKTTIGENKFYNDIKVGNKENGGEYTYYKAGVVKTDGNGNTGTTTINSDGKLTWNVEVTMDNQENTSLTIADTLPEGVTLDTLTLRFSDWSTLDLSIADDTISGSKDLYSVTGTYNAGIVSLTMTKSDGSALDKNTKYTFIIGCQAENSLKDGNQHLLNNNVTVTTDEGKIGSSSQTQNWTYDSNAEESTVIGKSGYWDNNNRQMDYTVVLNPEGKSLLNEEGTLILIDTLTYSKYVYYRSTQYTVSADLIQSSVKLYSAKQNEDGTWSTDKEIQDWSWTYSINAENDWAIKNTISASNVPDGTALILKYSYRVTSDAPNQEGVSFELPFSNTVKLEGTGYQGGSSSSGINWNHSTSSAGVTTDKSFTFYKVEAGNYNVSLAGATFSVYRYDSAENKYDTNPIKTYSTDDSGSFRIVREETDENLKVTFSYDYNTLYKVVETAPPEGYKLPDTVKEYYFYFSSEDDTIHTLPEVLPADVVNLSANSKTVYVENVKNTTQITVKKKWQDKNGNYMEPISGSITLNLYRKTSAENNSGGGDTGEESGTVTGISCNAICNHDTISKKFENVAVGDTVEILVEYTWEAGNNNNMTDHDWEWTGVTDGSGTWSATTYTYTCKLQSDAISFVTGDNSSSIRSITCELVEKGNNVSENPTTPSGGGSTTPQEDPFRSVTIDASNPNGWQYQFVDLPLTGTDEEGNQINYYYYVQEEAVQNYDVTYSENNTGIQSGTITVTNKAVENPEYELPETGGPGTRIAYTLGSMLMLAAAAFLYIKKKKMGEKGGLK